VHPNSAESARSFVEEVISYGHRFHPKSINTWEINKSFEARFVPPGYEAHKSNSNEEMNFRQINNVEMSFNELVEFYKSVLNDIGAEETSSNFYKGPYTTIDMVEMWEYEGVFQGDKKIKIEIRLDIYSSSNQYLNAWFSYQPVMAE
jgi:hypothetical protein